MLLAGVPDAWAQQPGEPSTYATLLAQLQAGEEAVDFRALRMAYTETDTYSPYSIDAKEQRQRMFEALFRDNDLDRTALIADSVLAMNYTDMDGHFALMVTHGEVGDSTRSAFHRTILQGLIDSIVGEADGRSPSMPWVVISTDEEYALLRVFGLENQEQSLVNCNGHRCDHLRTLDPETNEVIDIYFDIEIPWQHLASELQGGASR